VDSGYWLRRTRCWAGRLKTRDIDLAFLTTERYECPLPTRSDEVPERYQRVNKLARAPLPAPIPSRYYTILVMAGIRKRSAPWAYFRTRGQNPTMTSFGDVAMPSRPTNTHETDAGVDRRSYWLISRTTFELHGHQ